MPGKQVNLIGLQKAIEHRYECVAKYRETVPVHEVFLGQTVWQGDVEVFDLIGHSKASRCYGWLGKDEQGEQFVTALEIPPVNSAFSAIRAYIVEDAKTWTLQEHPVELFGCNSIPADEPSDKNYKPPQPPDIFPDPATCRVTRRTFINDPDNLDLLDCFGVWSWLCPHALKFGNSYLCRHPKGNEILARSEQRKS